MERQRKGTQARDVYVSLVTGHVSDATVLCLFGNIFSVVSACTNDYKPNYSDRQGGEGSASLNDRYNAQVTHTATLQYGDPGHKAPGTCR